MEKPCSQTQWKEPAVFRHSPWGPQSPGWSHSLISGNQNRVSNNWKKSVLLSYDIRHTRKTYFKMAGYFRENLICLHADHRMQEVVETEKLARLAYQGIKFIGSTPNHPSERHGRGWRITLNRKATLSSSVLIHQVCSCAIVSSI